MPNYDYKCPTCGRWFSENVPIIDRDHVTCGADIHGKMHPLVKAERQLAAPGIAFKGTGFYATDYKGKP